MARPLCVRARRPGDAEGAVPHFPSSNVARVRSPCMRVVCTMRTTRTVQRDAGVCDLKRRLSINGTLSVRVPSGGRGNVPEGRISVLLLVRESYERADGSGAAGDGGEWPQGAPRVRRTLCTEDVCGALVLVIA